MQDNLFIGPDADVRFALSILRAHNATGKISSENTTILNGITFSFGAGGKLQGSYHSKYGEILSLNLTCRSRSLPNWQCLTVPLGAMNLAEAAAIGFVARSSSPHSTVSRVTLRSGRDKDFVDQSFGKAMVSFAAPSTHLDLIDIGNSPNLPLEAQWRDLILFFRPGPLEIDILDLRVFVV